MNFPLNRMGSKNSLLIDTGVLKKILKDIGFSNKFWCDLRKHYSGYSFYITPTPLSFIEYANISTIYLDESYFLKKEEIKKCIADLNKTYELLKGSKDPKKMSLLISKGKIFFDLFFKSIRKKYLSEFKLSSRELERRIARLLESYHEKREESKKQNALSKKNEMNLDDVDRKLRGLLIKGSKKYEDEIRDIYNNLSIDFYFRFNYRESVFKALNIDMIIFQAIIFLYANYYKEEARMNISQFRAMIAVAGRVYEFYKKNRSKTGNCNKKTKEILNSIAKGFHGFRDLFDFEQIQTSCIGTFDEDKKYRLPAFVAIGINDREKYKNKERKDVKDRIQKFKMILRELNENKAVKENYNPIPFCDGSFLFVDSKTGEILEKLDVSSIDVPTLDPIISNIFKEFPFQHSVFDQFLK